MEFPALTLLHNVIISWSPRWPCL